MKIRILPPLLLTGLLVLSGSVLGPVAAEDPVPTPPVPIKIMFAGDSITQGFDGDYTWRYRVVQEFTRQAVPVDFVGPRKFTYGGSNHYLVPSTGPTAWDSDHDALGGTQLHLQLPRIENDVHTYMPDVLVTTLGTTDMIHGGTVASVIKDWKTYIASARAANPHLTIVLGELTSIRVPARHALNAAVRQMAADLDQPGVSPVRVYDMEHANWNPKTDTYDGTHPTPTGETIIAQRVAWALNGLGILGPPDIWHGPLRWPPTFTPVIHVDKQGRLVVNWRTTKRRNEAQFMRLRITNLRSGRSSAPSPWTRDLRLVRSLAPGRYTVSIRGLRGTMASVWGPAITVRVPRH